MEDPALPPEVLDAVHRSLTRTHRWLGNVRTLVEAIEHDTIPVRRVLDVGCGSGDLLRELRTRLGVEVVGVDLRPPKPGDVPIVAADATRDRLPQADVAVAVCVAHHLTDAEFAAMVSNVARSARRFLVLDLVQHRLPEALFRAFVAPWLHPINAADGVTSIRRSWTAEEFRRLGEAAAGSGARVRHTVAPFYVRQMLDIRWETPSGRA